MSMRHAFLGALLGALVFLACNRESTSAEIVGPEEPTAEEMGGRPLSPANLTLPFQGDVQSGDVAFGITQFGDGTAAAFRIVNQTTFQTALYGQHAGQGPAIQGKHLGRGTAGRFEIANTGNSSAAVDVLTAGTGTAINAWAKGGGRAGLFRITNANTIAFALEASTNGRAPAVYGGNTGTGGAALFEVTSAGNTNPAIAILTRGTGSGLEVDHRGSTGNLAVFQVNDNNRIRFTRDGKGFFNGGTQTGGADVAEAFEVEGPVRGYEPGDVLLISTRTDRRVERSNEAYSTRIAGVVATKPGVLLTERDIDANLDDTVPVGIVGVIPTKVSAENGPIRRGDMLVTARTAGHAMRGTSRSRMFGATIGRALAEFRGPGTGVIPVLVNVK